MQAIIRALKIRGAIDKLLVLPKYAPKGKKGLGRFKITEEDERQIKQLARDPKIVDKIIASIAPSIYGHTDIKTAVYL